MQAWAVKLRQVNDSGDQLERIDKSFSGVFLAWEVGKREILRSYAFYTISSTVDIRRFFWLDFSLCVTLKVCRCSKIIKHISFHISLPLTRKSPPRPHPQVFSCEIWIRGGFTERVGSCLEEVDHSIWFAKHSSLLRAALSQFISFISNL